MSNCKQGTTPNVLFSGGSLGYDLSFFATEPFPDHRFWCAMEREFTSSNTHILVTLVQDLCDVECEVDIKFFAEVHLFDQLISDIFSLSDVVNGGSVAGAQKAVRHRFANDSVIAATMLEQKHPGGNFTVSQKCSTSHCIVEIPVGSLKRQNRSEAVM